MSDGSFLQRAEELRSAQRQDEAIAVCVRGISEVPGNHRARLLLARLYYETSCVPFAVREVQHLLKEFPENHTLKKLLLALNPGASIDTGRNEGSLVTVAEAEFDLTELDIEGQDK